MQILILLAWGEVWESAGLTGFQILLMSLQGWSADQQQWSNSSGSTSYVYLQRPPSSSLGNWLFFLSESRSHPARSESLTFPFRECLSPTGTQWWPQTHGGTNHWFCSWEVILHCKCSVFSSSPRTAVLANRFVLWHLPASRNLINSNPKVNNTGSKGSYWPHFRRGLTAASVHKISLNWTSPTEFVINCLPEWEGWVKKHLRIMGNSSIEEEPKVKVMPLKWHGMM